MTSAEIIILLIIAVLGHVMAFFWLWAERRQLPLTRRRIYDIVTKDSQIRREFRNSLHTPLHSVILGSCLLLGFFDNTSVSSFFLAALATTVWAEIWHYWSHRLFHFESLHWIHAEHHKSMLNTPFTAISFSLSEKVIFDFGMLAPFLIADLFVSVNFFGIAAWFIGYLIINSFSHANFEFRGAGYNQFLGRVLATTTYHALHHSRYIRNYGLGTRFQDRWYKTEWEDYEPLYDRVTGAKQPLRKLRETVESDK